jgi:hypothetical protein
MKNLLKPLILLGLCTSILFSCKENKNEVQPENPTEFGFVQASSAELQGIENVPQLLMGTLPNSHFLNTPTPRNQGIQGSCTSWATGFAMGSFFMKNGVSYSSNADVCSPAYLYNQVKYTNCSGGSTYPANLNMMKNNGVCTLTEMPYNENDCNTQPNSTQHTAATKNKILKWELANKNDITNIKTLLYSGLPVMIAVNVDVSFDNLQSPYIWKAKSGAVRGGHAITVTGYDNSKNAFKVQNSWGSNWKDGGYLWIDYNFFPSAVIGNECYVAYPIKSSPTDNLTQGLVLHIPCNGNATDISGNNNHGTVGGATLVADRKGNANSAYQFGGFNNPNYIKVNNSTSLQIGNAFTMSVWVKINNSSAMDGWGNFNTTNSYQCLFAKDFDRDCIQAGVGYGYVGNSLFNTGISGNWGSNEGGNANISYQLGQWMMLTYVSTGNGLKLYKNGTLVINLPGSLSTNVTNSRDLYFGRFSSYWYPLDGVLDDMRMYNRALTDSEVQKLYQL